MAGKVQITSGNNEQPSHVLKIREMDIAMDKYLKKKSAFVPQFSPPPKKKKGLK
jgi:hypothetical protein